MKYDVISADGHVDLIWLPPDLFTGNARAEFKDRMPHVVDGPKVCPEPEGPHVLQPAIAHISWAKRSAWWRRWRRPDQVGLSPPAICWPGIHQRETSCGLAGSRRS